MFHLASEQPLLQNGADLGKQLDVARHDDSSDAILVPNADLMFSGDYKRAGTDLVLSSSDGEHFTIHDYFRGEKRPALLSSNGATLGGDIVEALTGHGSFAQAGPATSAAPVAIGKVATAQGNATAIRNGVAVTLNVGDAVYQGDVVQTGSGSSVGVVFTDGSTFNLSANARMVLNEFVYDPNGTSNAATISLVQGAITFLAGQVAKTGDMKVGTPVATMGIRGTAVNVNISADNGATNISVMAEADNLTHTVQVFDKTTGALLGVVTNNSGVFSFNPTPTGVLVQELAKDIATIQHEMAIVQQVFQTQAIGQQFLQGPDPNNTKTAQSATGTQFVVSDRSSTHEGTSNNTTTGPNVIKVVIGPEDNGNSNNNAPVHINTAPVAHADGNAVVEAGVQATNVAFAGTSIATGDVLANDTDLDPADVQKVISVSAVSAHLHGTLSLGADGKYIYTLDNDSPLTQQLAVGETVDDVFTYTISDLGGLTSTATLTITITGTNDAPVVAVADEVQTAAITEQDVTTGSTVLDVQSGSIHFTDVDLSDRPTATISGQVVTYLAADGHTVLTLTSGQAAAIKAAFAIAAVGGNTNDGTLDWTYSIQDKALDFLAKGETVTVVSTVLVDDQHGGTDTASITVTLTGTDDVPGVGGVPIIFPEDKLETGSVTELSNTTGSSANDHAAGGSIRFFDVDLNDRPTATIEAQAAFYRDADGSPMPPLSAAQLAAIVAGFTISVPTVLAAAPAGAGATGGLSSNTNNGQINWAYNITDSSLDFLAAGETVQLKSLILLDDHNGGTDTALVIVTITGTNDLPIVAVEDVSGGVTEQVTPAGNLTDTGLISFSDADLSDSHSINATITASEGALGSLTASVTADTTGTGTGGIITWNYSVADSAVEYLAKDETRVEHFTITLNDGNGGQIERTIDVTITGTNDAPVVAVADVTGGVTEQVAPAGNLTDTGTIAFTDADLIDHHSIDPTITASDGALGSLTASVTADTTGSGHGGVITWNYSVDDNAVEYLAKDETKVEHFTITLNDGNGGPIERTIDVTITGTNDAPIVAAANKAEAADIVEQDNSIGATAPDVQAGSIYFSDVDLTDRPTATIDSQSAIYRAANGTTTQPLSAAQLAAIMTAFTISAPSVAAAAPAGAAAASAFGSNTNNGQINWAYNITDSSLDFLAAGETVELKSVVLLDDHHGGTDSSTVTITIHGTNDAPVVAVADVTGGVTEQDAGNLTDTGSIAFADVDLTDHHNIDPTVTASEGALGSLTASVTADTTGTGTGGVVTWNYSVADSAVEYLAKDETKVEHFTITLNDGNGGQIERTIDVTITGTNDAPVVAAADVTGAVAEQVAPAGNLTDTGTIAFTDADLADHHSIDPTITASEGALGSLTASVTSDTTGTGNGGVITWNYSVDDNAVEYLAKDETKVEHFTITLNDGNGGQIERTIDVTITGTNDGPAAHADAASTAFGTPFHAAAAQGLLANDTDPDTIDTLAVSQINGVALDPSHSIPLAHGALSVGTDGSYTFSPTPGFSGVQNFNYTVSDGHGGSDTATASVTVDALVANILSFDTLPANQAAVANGYGGFNWSNFNVLNGQSVKGVANGYNHGMVSPSNVAYNGFGGTAAISGNEFNFAGADLTAAWNTGLHIQVTGYFHGTQLYSQTVTVNTNAPTWFDFNFNGVDQVTFTSSGGTDANAADGGSGTQFAMDNFAWNPASALHADPIVVDLGAPGVSLTSATGNPVWFDLNADGIKEQIGWTAGDDGILTVDLDHSGAIENGQEVFSPVFGHGGFATALDALRSYDSNSDGILDQRDAGFSDVFVWQDSNHDGISDQGELTSLLDSGISSLDLNATPAASEINGQQVVAEGQMSMTNGSTGQYLAVNLQSAPVNPVVADQSGNNAGFVGTLFDGGPGNDVFTATAAQDVFVFKTGGGHDTIIGFDVGPAQHDTIDLSGLHTGGMDVLALLAAAQDTSLGTLFTVGDDSLLVQDVHKQALTADHFSGVSLA